jgi:signal transduction histidine kinase
MEGEHLVRGKQVAMNPGRLRQWWDRLVEPYQPIPDEDQADRARLLAGLSLLGLLISFGLPTFYTIDSTSEARPLQWLTIMVCWVGIAFLYHQARKGLTQLPVVVVIVFSIGAIYLSPAFSPNEVGLIGLYYVVEIILFAAMFLSFRLTVAVAALILITMLALPFFYDRLTFNVIIQGPVSFTFFMTLVIALYIRYRLQSDERRRNRLTESQERYRRISEVTSDYAFSYRIEPGGDILKEWSTEPLPGVPENISLILNSSTEKAQLLDPEDSLVISSDVMTLLGGKQVGERDYRLRVRGDEDHWVRIYRYPVWSESEKRITHIYGAIKDVTERKRAETTTRRLKLQEERLNVVNHLTEAISHDFRTSLASIGTNRYLLDRHLPNDPDAQKRLKVIQDMVDHMAEQLDKFRHLAGLVQPQLLPTDLNTLLRQLVEGYRTKAQAKAIQLEFQPGEGLPPVQLDSGEIERAIGYLLDNALAFTPADGQVTVTTTLLNNVVQIAVRDTGRGIPAEALPHIYDFFYRADPARSTESGGVGIGLSLVKMIAEAHSGSVQVESRVYEGSCFNITLPIGGAEGAEQTLFAESLAAD